MVGGRKLFLYLLLSCFPLKTTISQVAYLQNVLPVVSLPGNGSRGSSTWWQHLNAALDEYLTSDRDSCFSLADGGGCTVCHFWLWAKGSEPLAAWPGIELGLAMEKSSALTPVLALWPLNGDSSELRTHNFSKTWLTICFKKVSFGSRFFPRHPHFAFIYSSNF